MNVSTLRNLPLMLLLALLALPALALADEDKPEKDTPITAQMNIINSSMKKLRKDVKKPELNKESAELAKKAVEAATKCLELMPDMTKSVPEKEREKFLAAYKQQMGELIATFKELEKALTENKNEDAEKVIEKLLDMKKKGHDKFTE